jgi:hypothetical protein
MRLVGFLLAMFFCVALSNAAQTKLRLPKPAPRHAAHVQAPTTAKHPAARSRRSAAARAPRPLSSVRHLGANPPVIGGTPDRVGACIDGKQVHRRP